MTPLHVLASYLPSVDPGGLPLLLSGHCGEEMGEGDESNSVCVAMEGLCQKGYPSPVSHGRRPREGWEVPKVAQHIRGTASTRMQVSWVVGSAFSLGHTGGRTCAFPSTYSEGLGPDQCFPSLFVSLQTVKCNKYTFNFNLVHLHIHMQACTHN